MGRYTVEYGDKIFAGKSVNHKGYVREDGKFRCTMCDFTNIKQAGMRQHVTKRHGCMFCVNDPNSTHDHGDKEKRKLTTYVKKVKRRPKGFGKKGLAMKKAAEEAARLGLPQSHMIKPKIKRKRREYKKRKRADNPDVSEKSQENSNLPPAEDTQSITEDITIIDPDAVNAKENNVSRFPVTDNGMDVNNNNIVLQVNDNYTLNMDNNNDPDDTFQIEDESGNLIFIKLDSNKYGEGTEEYERTTQIQNMIIQLNHYKNEYDKLKVKVEKTESLLYQSKKDLGDALTSSESLRRQNHNLYEKYQIEVSTLIETQEQNKKLEEINQKNSRFLARLLNDRDSMISTNKALQNIARPQIAANVQGVINDTLDKLENNTNIRNVPNKDESNSNNQFTRVLGLPSTPINIRRISVDLQKAVGNCSSFFPSEKLPAPRTSSSQVKRSYNRTQSSVCSIPAAPLEKVKIDDDLLDWADQLIQ